MPGVKMQDPCPLVTLLPLGYRAFGAEGVFVPVVGLLVMLTAALATAKGVIDAKLWRLACSAG
jgi:hypothetical protein